MARYDPYGEPNFGQKVIGWLLLALLGLAVLAGLAAGIKWLWLRFLA